MYSDDDLDTAVQSGALSSDSVRAFREHIQKNKVTPAIDEEYFRLVTGFNDIFVVIACLLLLISILWIGKSESFLLGSVLEASTAWGLAEYFTRKRRMALPSIVLLLAFVGGAFAVGLSAQVVMDLTENEFPLLAPAAAIAAIAAWLHWQRFKVPITMAAGAVALVTMIMAVILSYFPVGHSFVMAFIFIAGIGIFLLAMKWDSSDVVRKTRRSDIAFWLHLVAAPLLVHPIFLALNIFDSEVGILQIVAVSLLYVFIALISISIDRRAMMVSALIYVLYAFNTLLEQYGIVSLGFAFTAFSIGSGLLLLSAFWHVCRKRLLAFYPETIRKKLPALR